MGDGVGRDFGVDSRAACGGDVFRGVLYRIFKWAFAASRFGAFAAAVLSGVLFALIHADAYVFVPLALMGVFLCMAYEKGGSILSPILVHAAFNALNVAIVWFAK